MEKVVKEALVDFLETKNLFNPNQHGFRSGRSTISQLIEHQEQILTRLEHGGLVDVVYLDFAKAFDKVDFGVLMESLKNFGVTGKIGVWFHNFLVGRKQFVHADGQNSELAEVVSGVPQGTVLGPILFLILLTTIDKNVLHSFISSFADDTKLVHGVSNENEAKQLQEDLDGVYQWAQEVNMKFNGSKFQLLRYGQNTKLKDTTSYTSCDGNVIEEASAAKDLGVIMSSSGTFEEHISKTVQKASAMSGWIFRTFKTRSVAPMMTLYKCLVLSKLDYCSVLWHPHGSAALTNKIETVQRAFTRRLENMNDLNYWERLNALRLYSVQRRRERYIILYMFKILHGLVPNCGISFQTNERTGIHATVPLIRQDIPKSIKQNKLTSFSYVGPKLYNILPSILRVKYLTCDITTDNFKGSLDAFLTNIPDEPTVSGLVRLAESNSLIHQIPLYNTQKNF